MCRTFWLAAVFVALGATGCGSSTNNNGGDGGGGGDAGGNPGVDSGGGDSGNGGTDTGTDAHPDAGTTTTTSNAGNACMTDDQCGGTLSCDTMAPNGGSCTADCVNNASQSNEQMQCGGRGSTCLTFIDNNNVAVSTCRHACTPAAHAGAAGACPAGMICTGWWNTTMDGTPDSPGCDFFCTADAQCGSANPTCNVRTGECGTRAYNPMAIADGEPCDPTVTTTVDGMPQNTQCRGICFSVSNTDTHAGICGSFINVRAVTACPDNPMALQPAGVTGDNLGICNFKQCMTDADCTAPLRCIPDPMGGPSLCDYASNAPDGGLPPADAGTHDAGTHDAAAHD